MGNGQITAAAAIFQGTKKAPPVTVGAVTMTFGG
jgi:hypothetical protein